VSSRAAATHRGPMLLWDHAVACTCMWLINLLITSATLRPYLEQRVLSCIRLCPPHTFVVVLTPARENEFDLISPSSTGDAWRLAIYVTR
jgi:hypothetical protein